MYLQGETNNYELDSERKMTRSQNIRVCVVLGGFFYCTAELYVPLLVHFILTAALLAQLQLLLISPSLGYTLAQL